MHRIGQNEASSLIWAAFVRKSCMPALTSLPKALNGRSDVGLENTEDGRMCSVTVSSARLKATL